MRGPLFPVVTSYPIQFEGAERTARLPHLGLGARPALSEWGASIGLSVFPRSLVKKDAAL